MDQQKRRENRQCFDSVFPGSDSVFPGSQFGCDHSRFLAAPPRRPIEFMACFFRCVLCASRAGAILVVVFVVVCFQSHGGRTPWGGGFRFAVALRGMEVLPETALPSPPQVRDIVASELETVEVALHGGRTPWGGGFRFAAALRGMEVLTKSKK